ncbi:prolyl endopeptidase-like [Rhinophrynus dorsalis]
MVQSLGLHLYGHVCSPNSRQYFLIFLDTERKHWQTASVKYNDLAAVLKKRLDQMHECYPTHLEREMIKHDDYLYFEENGCIYRFQQNIGEESLEVLLCLEDIGFGDEPIQRIRVSPKHNFLAATVKSFEREESTCIIVKLGNAPKVTYCIPNVFSFEWVTNNVLFHTRQENLQCHHVYLTDFSNGNATKLVYTEKDPRFFVDIYCTRDKRFLTINSNSKNTSEVWLVDSCCPFDPPILVQQRVPGIIYHIEHRNGYLYILTTHGGHGEYKLMKTAVSSVMDPWQLVYQEKEKTKIVDMEMLKDHCVMLLKYRNQLYLDIISLNNESVIQHIKLPAWACAFESDHHPEYNTSNFSFYLASPIHHPICFVYSVLESRLTVVDNHNTTDAEMYQTVRLEAKSKDGALVPITVFYKDCNDRLTEKPLLIHVYGAYGMDLNMSFKAEKRMLVDDGWILAYCHVRGGGELGHNWHKDGILDKKLRGLDDLAACVVHLHELGYSKSRITALEASSAGGVLAGALYNFSPHLFQAMVLEAPFLDVLNTMMDTSLPLTIEEQEEWGNPLYDKKYHRYIGMYCPYQNIKPQYYPSVLITAYENDQRIPLEGLVRYIKNLRKAVADFFHKSKMPESRIPNIFLNVRPGGSHCDSLNWEDSLQKVATHIAFLHKELNLDERKSLENKR